jgi:hypothetical protein
MDDVIQVSTHEKLRVLSFESGDYIAGWSLGPAPRATGMHIWARCMLATGTDGIGRGSVVESDLRDLGVVGRRKVWVLGDEVCVGA